MFKLFRKYMPLPRGSKCSCICHPDQDKPIVCKADTKSTENFIVSSVVYENGEIIAARDGGRVVKILQDGTEIELLRIGGASDWRGLFLDSKNNVFISPHASVSGNIRPEDRGIYKLEYGAEAFKKVYSLYNPESVHEFEQYSDMCCTIWTFCEDRNGTLYAGAYEHKGHKYENGTKLFNPSVYKSVDGGESWNLIYNFSRMPENRPLCKFGKHIHSIVYNPYDDSLYVIVGEKNTIFRSVDGGCSWTDLRIKLEMDKGTCMLPVKDGIVIGSDSAYNCMMYKLYADTHIVKTTAKLWANTIFSIRESDATGWLYAFGKIDSSVNLTKYFPPKEAIDDVRVLQEWKDSSPLFYRHWKRYYESTKKLYPLDCVRPQHAVILISKDNGESWGILYKEFTGSEIPAGYWTTGFFRNGECLTGYVDETRAYSNPLVISDKMLTAKKGGMYGENDIYGILNKD